MPIALHFVAYFTENCRKIPQQYPWDTPMNAIWTTLLIICLALLTVTSPNSVLTLCVESGKQALDYTFELVAIYALWQGVFCVAEKCNLVESLAKFLSKLNNFLYGNVTRQAQEYLALNMASNLVGVGNASTPSAIEAINLMEQEEKLTRGGAMLFVVNACGLQIVPTTVIGLRATFGSQNPSSVLLPNIVCTVATLILGVFLTNLAYHKNS